MSISGKKENAAEQLLAARWITQTVGAIHQAQVDQMIVWSYLCIPQAEYGELELSFDSTDKVIQVEVKAKRKNPPKGSKMRLQLLANNLQFLLGEDWDLVVVRDGKAIFGERRPVADKINEQRAAIAGVGTKPPDAD